MENKNKNSTGEILLENRDIAAMLHQIPRVGTVTLSKLHKILDGNWLSLLEDKHQWGEIRLIKDFPVEMESYLDPKKILEYRNQLDRQGIKVTMLGESGYPSVLAEIDNPPFLLYGIGNMDLLLEFDCIGIVGTRVPSTYGRMVAHRLSAELATADWTIVSGMASGIDAYAHNGALSVKGNTIAVLGSGINVIFPKENTKLYQAIAENGLIISEYPPDLPPNKGLFPQRNRIISGLSRGVVVVESHNRSGSLITATWALEQGKEVFAVPGSILSAKSSGPHKLIKEGAKIVTSARDILEELYYPQEIEQITLSLSETAVAITNDEKELLDLISYNQIHIDEIFRSSSMSRGIVHQSLFALETKKLIRKLPGYFYVKY